MLPRIQNYSIFPPLPKDQRCTLTPTTTPSLHLTARSRPREAIARVWKIWSNLVLSINSEEEPGPFRLPPLWPLGMGVSRWQLANRTVHAERAFSSLFHRQVPTEASHGPDQPLPPNRLLTAGLNWCRTNCLPFLLSVSVCHGPPFSLSLQWYWLCESFELLKN